MKKYLVPFAILLLLNGLFIVSNIRLIKQLEQSDYTKNKIYFEFFENTSRNSILNPIDYKYKNIYFTQETLLHFSNYMVVSIFKNDGCKSCIISEIQELNKIYVKYSENILVYFRGKDESFLRQNGAIFPYKLLINNNSLFTKKIHYSEPISFLIDKNKTILDIHKAERGAIIKSKLFYSRFVELLKTK